MPRVKGGTVTRKRRKKVLKLAKGYFGSKHTLYKVISVNFGSLVSTQLLA